jgi:hypothetical protein
MCGNGSQFLTNHRPFTGVHASFTVILIVNCSTYALCFVCYRSALSHFTLLRLLLPILSHKLNDDHRRWLLIDNQTPQTGSVQLSLVLLWLFPEIKICDSQLDCSRVINDVRNDKCTGDSTDNDTGPRFVTTRE